MSNGRSSFVFTEEEVKQELARLGITNIDNASLQQFRNELRDLIQEVSASSTGFPNGSSSSTGIGSGTCSDSSDAEGKNDVIKSLDSSSSISSTPSSLLTPPLSRNNSAYNVPMMVYKNSVSEQNNNNNIPNIGQIRRAWEDDAIDPPVPPPSWKNPELGRIQQVDPNPENVTSTLLPPETKTDEPIHHHLKNDKNDLLLEELLRASRVLPGPKKLTKRKIARKDATGKTYVDESYTDSESGSVLDPIDYLERLREMNKSIYEVAAASSEKSREVSISGGFSSVSSYGGRPKSVILAPRFQKIKKTDPVTRYHEHRDYWALHTIPGENKHSQLRWCVKERMLHNDQIESRPRKVYVPNNYVVPSEKPRHSLRWQIRTDLAYGFMPSRECRSYSSCS